MSRSDRPSVASRAICSSWAESRLSVPGPWPAIASPAARSSTLARVAQAEAPMSVKVAEGLGQTIASPATVSPAIEAEGEPACRHCCTG